MWESYLNCKTWGGRPSQNLAWPCFANRLTAWKFDNAVLFVGLTIENALLERDKVGGKDNYETEARYTLAQILEPAFRLRRPASEQSSGGESPQGDGLAWLMAMARQANSGVKAWGYVGPEKSAPQ